MAKRKGRYTFDVTTLNKWGEPNRAYSKEIAADSMEEASEKLEKCYSSHIDAELVRAYDAEGNLLH